MSSRTAAAPRRATDPGVHLLDFIEEVLVLCPRCGGVARATCAAPWQAHAPRLVCGRCALVRDGWPDARTLRYGGPFDPYFGLPLALATTVRGRPLWALNRRHLAALADWIAAALRERPTPERRWRWQRAPRKTMLAMLPTWMRRAAYRDEVTAALSALAARVDG